MLAFAYYGGWESQIKHILTLNQTGSDWSLPDIRSGRFWHKTSKKLLKCSWYELFHTAINTFTIWQQGCKQEVRRVFSMPSEEVFLGVFVCSTRSDGDGGKVNGCGRHGFRITWAIGKTRTRTGARKNIRNRKGNGNLTWTRTRNRNRTQIWSAWIRNRVTIQTESLILLWVGRERVSFSFKSYSIH